MTSRVRAKPAMTYIGPTPGISGVFKVRERPILFSAPMIRALLDNTKTQTRRIVSSRYDFEVMTIDGISWPCLSTYSDAFEEVKMHCRYGQPGDRLWVKETWRTDAAYDPYAPNQIDSGASLFMMADQRAHRINHRPECGLVEWGRTRASIHMPRWASRINLEIASVRVERLQDISEADAKAEGVCASGWSPSYSNPDNAGCDESISAVENYAELWEQINGPGSWDLNPFVWCISFKRLEAA